MGVMRRTWCLPVVLGSLFLCSPAEAQPNDVPLCREWALNIWGITRHFDEAIDYNDLNWGAGVRCHARPEWTWLGSSPQNTVFLQGDALRNSHRGLLLASSAGAEFRAAPLGGDCHLWVAAALTVAYYVNPLKGSREALWGPVPGVSAGCGRVRVNVIFIPVTSRRLFTAATASFSVFFPR